MLGSSPEQKSRHLFVVSAKFLLLYFVACVFEYSDYFPNAFY